MTPTRDGARRDRRPPGGLRLVGEGRLQGLSWCPAMRQCLHRTARYEERDGTRDREIVSLKWRELLAPDWSKGALARERGRTGCSLIEGVLKTLAWQK